MDNKYRNLVFSGGGILGVAYIGMLDYLYRIGIMPNLQRVAGTSAGAITACITSFNLPFIEMKRIADSLNYSKVPSTTDPSDFNFFSKHGKAKLDKVFVNAECAYRLITKYGWYSSSYFYYWIKKQIADDYKRPEYKKRNFGYQKVRLSDDLTFEIYDYINTAHLSSNKKYMARKEKNARADSVVGGKRIITQNYYIFLNTLGSRLEQDTWNRTLRKIYDIVGIKVDKGSRMHNLNHRLRHGYAMFLTDCLNVSPFDVQEMMRHKKLSSTAIYHNPKEEDIDKLQNLLIQKWKNYLLSDTK